MSDEYDAYLRSPWWTARKAAIIRYRGAWCERCGSTDQLELHHRTYIRLGHELPEDVELLCWRCHRLEHGLPTRDQTLRIDHGFSKLDFNGFLEQISDDW